MASTIQVQRLEGRSDTYELVEPLGEGGFGITHRARRLSDGQEVVVKQLRMERVGDWKSVELFEREAAVLRGLDHPGIPRHLDDFALGDAQAPSGYGLVQELVPGRTLEAIRRSGGLAAAEHAAWLLDILEVCRYLHARQPPVVHRDISPKNIVVRPDGRAVLLDFGLVQARVAGSVAGSTSAGTFGYAPMEQFVGRAVPSSDLYGLAVTFVAAVTGREPEALPFDGIRLDVRAALAGLEVDARVLLALEAMTEPDVSRRKVDAESLLQRLAPLRGGGARPGAAPPVPARTSPAPQAALPSADEAVERAQARWRTARERSLRLGARAVAEAWLPDERICAVAFSDDGTRALLALDGGVHDLDLTTMRATRLHQSEYGGGARVVALSGDGRCGASMETIGGLRLYARQPDGTIAQRSLEVEGLSATHDRLALSPNGELLAVGGHFGMLLVDTHSGRVVQRLERRSHRELTFAPDGRSLLVGEHRETSVFAMDGGESKLPTGRFAFSPDGRLLAQVPAERDHLVQLGAFESLAPLRWQPRTLTPYPKPGLVQRLELEALRFSPDGTRLAVGLEVGTLEAGAFTNRHEVRVLDVHSGDVLASFRGMGTGAPGALERITGLGFASDNDRVLIAASVRLPPSSASIDAVLVASVVQRQVIGALCVRDDEHVLRAVASCGLYGRLDGKRPGDAGALERPAELARVLLGEPLEAVASDEVLRDQAADLALRVEQVAWLRERGTLAAEEDGAALVRATAGLSHLLPHLIERALAEGGSVRFGQSSATPRVAVATLERLATDLRKRSPQELDLLFEQSLESAVATQARELAAAEAAARAAEVAERTARKRRPQIGLAMMAAGLGVVIGFGILAVSIPEALGLTVFALFGGIALLTFGWQRLRS